MGKPRQAHARIQATMTRQGGRGPIADHERNVLAITRRIHSLERGVKTAKRELAEMRKELLAKRRELRAVLQRDSRITEDDESMTLAGLPDAIDASEHRREH